MVHLVGSMKTLTYGKAARYGKGDRLVGKAQADPALQHVFLGEALKADALPLTVLLRMAKHIAVLPPLQVLHHLACKLTHFSV